MIVADKDNANPSDDAKQDSTDMDDVDENDMGVRIASIRAQSGPYVRTQEDWYSNHDASIDDAADAAIDTRSVDEDDLDPDMGA